MRADPDLRVAPAAAHAPAVSASMPPSTSRSASSPMSARMRRTLSTEDAMNGWPPQPGLTVMHSAMSTSTSR